jgi:transcriptional regulator with XRE-family HTH domain
MPKASHSKKGAVLRELLIQWRDDAGVTQVELAKRLSRPQSFVSKYERGERRLDVLELIEVCRALGRDASQFVRDLTAKLEK